MKVYTRTGDKGTTALFGGKRRSKTDPVFEALGNTDELNAMIGLANARLVEFEAVLSSQLEVIQSRLIDVGSALATPLTEAKEDAKKRTEFSENHVVALEKWIDEMEETLPPLKNFILPVSWA